MLLFRAAMRVAKETVCSWTATPAASCSSLGHCHRHAESGELQELFTYKGALCAAPNAAIGRERGQRGWVGFNGDIEAMALE